MERDERRRCPLCSRRHSGASVRCDDCQATLDRAAQAQGSVDWAAHRARSARENAAGAAALAAMEEQSNE